MKRKLKMGAEQFTLPVKFEYDDDANTMTFKGMASVFNNPVETFPPTRIKPGAFSKTLRERGGRDVVVLWQHDAHDPIGRPLELKETDLGLEMRFVLDEVPNGLRAAKQIRSGTIKGLSIGFDPIQWETVVDERGEEYRLLTEIRLHEVSVVTFPAQAVAQIKLSANRFRDLPVAPAGTEWDAEAALGRVKEWAGDWKGDDRERFSRAFLAGAGDRQVLQIADVVDGKLCVVPEAVYAASVRRDEWPEGAEEYIEEHVQAYYEKLGREQGPTALRCLFESVVSRPDITMEAAGDALDIVAALLREMRAAEGITEQHGCSLDIALKLLADALEALRPQETEDATEPEATAEVEPTAEEASNQPDPVADAERRVKEMELALFQL